MVVVLSATKVRLLGSPHPRLNFTLPNDSWRYSSHPGGFVKKNFIWRQSLPPERVTLLASVHLAINVTSEAFYRLSASPYPPIPSLTLLFRPEDATRGATPTLPSYPPPPLEPTPLQVTV